MSALAESSLEPTSARQWAVRAVLALMALALLAGLVVGIKSLLGAPSPQRHQTARIAILPDTPPPPPPPKEEKKPEPPKDELKQVMREEPVHQDVPKPADAPIKMDGPAGDGPSAFTAGNVSSDYKGGTPVIGGTGGGSGVDRAQERLYANSVRQLLHDEIEKNMRPESGEVVATFSVWIDPDGTLRRFELVPTGDAARDTALRAAFEQTTHSLHLPGHNGVTQPLRFRLSVRPA